MKKVEIEEAQNGYVVRCTKLFGGDIIESHTYVCHKLDEVKKAIADYFMEEGKIGYQTSDLTPDGTSDYSPQLD